MAEEIRSAHPSREGVNMVKQRGNMLVGGILLSAAGMIFACDSMAFSGIAWPAIGLMLCTTGALQYYIARQFRGAAMTYTWATVVTFYGLFGLFAFTYPTRRFVLLSLLFFVGLTVTGLVRCYTGFAFRTYHGWTWLLAGGATTMIVAGYLIVHWPHNNLSIASALLALDMIAYGVSVIGFSLASHRRHERCDLPRRQ